MLRTSIPLAMALIAIHSGLANRAAAGCMLIESENAVVQDGDVYDCLRFTGGTLEVIGGRIKRLEIDNGRPETLVNIRGGEVGGSAIADENIVLYGGAVAIYGGRVRGAIIRPDSLGARIDIHGLEFLTFSTQNHTRVGAWLLDLSYIDIPTDRPPDSDPGAFPLSLVEYPGRVDTNGDYFFDLNDLNNVRNHFGENGFADLNEDGVVDLIDLNRVRNKFGQGFDFSTEVVPEPSTLLLAAASLLAFARIAVRRLKSPD